MEENNLILLSELTPAESVKNTDCFLVDDGTAENKKTTAKVIKSYVRPPDASATTDGLITTLAQTIAGKKTFLEKVIANIQGNADTATTATTAENSNKLGGKLPGEYEPSFTKKTAFNKNFGKTADSVCQGNDERLSNSRTANGGKADTATLAEKLTTKNVGNTGVPVYFNNGVPVACTTATTTGLATKTINGLMSSTDKAKLDLLTTGSAVLASNFGGNSGYIKFRNGLIIQWCKTVVHPYGLRQAWTFPISFSKAYFLLATGVGKYTQIITAMESTKTYGKFGTYKTASGSSEKQDAYLFAIGY